MIPILLTKESLPRFLELFQLTGDLDRDAETLWCMQRALNEVQEDIRLQKAVREKNRKS